MWCEWQHVGTAEVQSGELCEVLSLKAKNFLPLLQKDPLIKQISSAYARSFQSLMSIYTASGSDIDDLDTGFGVGEVMASMPEEAVRFVSREAVRTLVALSDFSDEMRARLDEEAWRSDGVLLITRKHGVSRCVLKTVLDVTRDDGRKLLRLQTSEALDGSLKASCAMPEVERSRCQSIEECKDHLMNSAGHPLAALQTGLCLFADGVRKFREFETSRKQKLSTSIVYTVISAQWKDEGDAVINERMVTTHRENRTPMSHRKYIQGLQADVFCLHNDGLYTWLAQDSIDYLNSIDGNAKLVGWISMLHTQSGAIVTPTEAGNLAEM